jgi:hypothetical protein
MNRYAVVTTLLLIWLSVTTGALPPVDAQSDEPVAGIHAIRASDDLLQMAVDGGFRWMVQLLEWREIEPVPGECFWEYADWLVRATEHYGLDLVLRLDHPPAWAITADSAMPVNTTWRLVIVGVSWLTSSGTSPI